MDQTGQKCCSGVNSHHTRDLDQIGGDVAEQVDAQTQHHRVTGRTSSHSLPFRRGHRSWPGELRHTVMGTHSDGEWTRSGGGAGRWFTHRSGPHPVGLARVTSTQDRSLGAWMVAYEEADVVVIGSGMGGLAAARHDRAVRWEARAHSRAALHARRDDPRVLPGRAIPVRHRAALRVRVPVRSWSS